MTNMNKGQQERQNTDLKRRLNIMGDAVTRLESEIQQLKITNAILEAEKKRWEMEKVQQQTIIQQTLAAANLENQENLEEITRLREVIRGLKGE